MNKKFEYPRGFKGVFIPAEVYLDKRLSALDKIILTEINSLDVEDGCYASNEYLAEFCQCSVSNVTKTISKLKELGYVKQVKSDGRKRWLKTCLILNIDETNKIYDSESQNLLHINIDSNIDNKVVGVVNSTEINNNLANTTNQEHNDSQNLKKLKQTFVEIAGKDLADELENTKVSSYKNHLEDLSIDELNKLELLSSIGRDIGYPDYRLLQNHFSLTNLVTKRTPEECRKLVNQKEKELKKKQLADSTTPKITRDMLSNETF